MLLYWKPVAEKMIEEQKKKVIKYFPNKDKFLAILFFWDNSSSKVYVRRKKEYWENIWLETRIFWQDDGKSRNKDDILKLINDLNKNDDCVWIIVQLPLPEDLVKDKNEIL